MPLILYKFEGTDHSLGWKQTHFQRKRLESTKLLMSGLNTQQFLPPSTMRERGGEGRKGKRWGEKKEEKGKDRKRKTRKRKAML